MNNPDSKCEYPETAKNMIAKDKRLPLRVHSSKGRAALYYCTFSAGDLLKRFSYFSKKTSFDMSCKFSSKETICMECQSLFTGKNKKNTTNMSSAELAKRVQSLKRMLTAKGIDQSTNLRRLSKGFSSLFTNRMGH